MRNSYSSMAAAHHCRLCGVEAPLVKSHTIPQALHKDTQKLEETGEFIRIYSDQYNYEPESRTGVWDRIVCDDCEKRFQDWDQYGIEFVRTHRSGQTGRLIGQKSNPSAIAIDDFSYGILKLFVLSMLWRADANGQPLFRRINLGDKWRTQLTSVILSGDPGPPEFFSVAATLFKAEQEKYFMADPHREKYEHVNFVRFYVYGGFTFLIKVDSRECPSPLNLVQLTPDGPFLTLLRNLSLKEQRLVQKLLS